MICNNKEGEPVSASVFLIDKIRGYCLIGATNPEDAEDGTIRKVHAVSLEKNSVHGSDSPENAAIELAHFFDEEEIYP